MDPITAAKDVVGSHERFAKSGDLEGIMSNVASDVVVLSPNAALVSGAAAFHAMYEGLLKAGTFDFTHDYHGAEVAGDLVVLHGIASGTFAPTGQPANHFANNFIIVMKRSAAGRNQFWRIAFAPAS